MLGIDDVLVVGGGPAGRALAGACARCGLRTALLDPAPDRAWRNTYGAWAAELPTDLPAGVVAARVRARAVAVTEHDLGWDYAVLDVPALRAHLDAELEQGGVTVHAGRAVGFAPAAVILADGSRRTARLVVDAAGHRRPGRSDSRQCAEQTAHGVVVDEATAAPLVSPGEALFMDWRPDHGERGWPTFLYAVPLGGGRVMLEETSLARRPGLPQPELARRLHARLARHGIRPDPEAAVERVRFPLDAARHRGRDVLGFGAAAPLVHPATGFSLATALTLAPRVATALATTGMHPPAAALAAGRRVVWPGSARAVHAFRGVGLEALLRMPPEEVPAFFEVFLALPARHRWSYLTGRDDLAATVATMAALFRVADRRLRTRLLAPALRTPLRGDGRYRR